MRRYEKVLLAGFLALSVALFVFACTLGARAYSGTANITSAALSDTRVNPSQSVTWTPGPVLNATGQPVGGGNSSLSFDGVNQYVSVPPHASLDLNTAFTISFWLKGSNTARNEYHIIFYGGPTFLCIRQQITTGRLFTRIQNRGDTNGATNVADGDWHHVAWVVNLALGASQLYVDGAADGAQAAVAGGADPSGHTVYIGGLAGFDNFHYTGVLDEVRVYNGRALTPAEVTQHSQGVYVDETGLVLYLDFDGEALDQSGNGNDGTLQNGPAYTDGWASVPVSTYWNATQSVADRRILVNSTDGDPLSTIPDTAPATWGNYTATLAPDASIGNATVTGFLVDTIAVDLHAVYSTVPTSLPATIYSNSYSLVDGHNLTDADALTVSGYAFAWNTYTGRFEVQITKATPQSYTLNTVTALSEANYTITAGTVTTPVTITVVQRGSSLIYQYLPAGDVSGLIFSVYTQALNIQVTWLIIMLIGSVFLYRRLGAIPTALIWLLSWGGFVAVFPPVAINLAVGMLLIGVAAVFFLAFFYWRRGTT